MHPEGETRILFVDDEPIIREVLRLTVQTMRGEWASSFARSGPEALALMKQTPFDVVLSDMHMPGMTGAELLNEVMQQHPETVRIILSGGAERELALQCAGAAHLFLNKPFQVTALRATLQRIGGLRQRLHSPEVQKLVARKDHLPSIPAVYFKMLKALARPECPIQEIAEIVATDPGLTSKTLQLVNSAFFGIAREVASAEEAVLLLGVSTVRALSLSTQLVSSFKCPAGDGFSIELVWSHCMRVGRLARRIVQLEGGDEELAEQAFTGGMLHDVGKFILAHNLGTRYLELVTRARNENRLVVEIEREALQATHAEVGAYLLDLWGLPAPLVEAVALHHQPSAATGTALTALAAVHVADALVREREASDLGRLAPQLDEAYLQQLGLHERIASWREELAVEP